jgi:hypothetical protein
MALAAGVCRGRTCTEVTAKARHDRSTGTRSKPKLWSTSNAMIAGLIGGIPWVQEKSAWFHRQPGQKTQYCVA